MIQAIDERKADVAVMTNSQDGERFLTVPFRRHRLTTLVPASQPFSTRDQVHLSELENERMVFRVADSCSHHAFQKAMVTHDVSIEPVLAVKRARRCL